MAEIPYRAGLYEIAPEVWAWLQPDGSWGWSNAGLVVDGEASLIVDTLFDLPLTRRMLAAMADASPAARDPRLVVNTHANGDHCYGNAALPDARIVASKHAIEEMGESPPALLARFMAVGRVAAGLPWPLGAVPVGSGATLRDLGAYLVHCFGGFDFRDTPLVKANEGFEGTLSLTVGDRPVTLREVGPAHTRGDVIVHLPDAGVVFTGDILFSNGHPLVWAGPVSSWIAAIDAILAYEPRVVVPGHGPLCGPEVVARQRDYFVWLKREATARFEAGMSALDAALDLDLSPWEGWGDAERVAANVAAVYRELRGVGKAPLPVQTFILMAAWRRRRGLSPRS